MAVPLRTRVPQLGWVIPRQAFELTSGYNRSSAHRCTMIAKTRASLLEAMQNGEHSGRHYVQIRE